MKKLLASILFATSVATLSNPASAQMSYQTNCRYWENGVANSVVPCVVQFASDGYVGVIQTRYDTYTRGHNGWRLGVANKECLRSTGSGTQIAVCPVTQ